MATITPSPPNAPTAPITLPASPLDIEKLVNDYVKQMGTDDAAIGQQMQTELVRVIFQILINLAYVLFVIGVALGLKSGLTGLQRISDYISSPGHEAFLCVIAFLTLTIFAISQVFSKSTALTTRAKRDLDLVVDFLRVVIYIFFAFLMGPFVFTDPTDMILILSFWALVLAATLFLIRKLLKWYVFLCKDPANLKPWEDFKVVSPFMLLQFAQLQQYMAHQLLAKQPQPAPEKKVEIAKKPTPPPATKVTPNIHTELAEFDMDDGLFELRQEKLMNEDYFEHPV